MSHALHEVHLDGLVGPTFSRAFSIADNVASVANAGRPTSPRAAALQGLTKMKRVADLGGWQVVLPPQERPDVGFLRRVGFAGPDHAVIAAAARQAPALLAQACSSSAMWAANAATVTPSCDAGDGRVHITPANLAAHLHRALEAGPTTRILRRVFPEEAGFVHHAPLPCHPGLGDEGAANQMRLGDPRGEPRARVFVHGVPASGAPHPVRRLGRQTLAASEALARQHGLYAAEVVFAQQHPDAIDAGAIHNDVVALAAGTVVAAHARAWLDAPAIVEALRARIVDMRVLLVSEEELPLTEAVGTYVFNSQLLRPESGRPVLLASADALANPRARTVLERICDLAGAGQPHEVELSESMSNGGGPACLRLRCLLTPGERERLHGGLRLTDALYEALRTWIMRHYRERLDPADLSDPRLLDEVRCALDELTGLLGLGSLYPFQGATN